MRSFLTFFLLSIGCLMAAQNQDTASLAEVNDEITDVQQEIEIYQQRAYFAGQAAGRLMSLDYFSARQRALKQQQYLAIVTDLQERLKSLQEERAKLLQENGNVNSGKAGGD